MAADAEYGPHLGARISPVMTGVGPVEAAVSVTAALAAGKPDLVISLGSAGSARLTQTEVYQASSVSYRDMDASALGFPKGQTPFLDLPAELPLSPLVPGLPTARLSTGANVVSGRGYAGIDADMVDMETFAILRACQRFGVPLIVLRGISDGTEPLEGFESWTRYLHIVDEKLAVALDSVEAFWRGQMR
ncbi:5'-methylthioadenosine/S-adenosylhomocysteine nucleosidase [Pelagibacterium limicola]|uniref:5'-methylthioadenosine/S-adenosylhomocysteine nucleosidase n=1 Tax=Pelagibacterium limicola TaxID=2791022 RepID=UPI0018AF9D99|nr:5'-methylthioadenosine/S-adenosylhomocysteine nucleosidase [Pelagibacterium limicola]